MLSSSKKLSEEISVKQEIATKTEEEIDKTRGGYKPVGEGLQFNLRSKLKNRYSYLLHLKQNCFVQSTGTS